MLASASPKRRVVCQDMQWPIKQTCSGDIPWLHASGSRVAGFVLARWCRLKMFKHSQQASHPCSAILVPMLTLMKCVCVQVNTRPDSECAASSSSSQANEPISRSGSAQSLEHIHRVSAGGSSIELDSPTYPMPATPKPLDRSNSNRSLGSDSNNSIGIAAVHAAPDNLPSGMHAQDITPTRNSLTVGAGSILGSEKTTKGFNKWMVGLIKGSNASKKKEARISQLLKAAAAAGGAVGGGQYCTADAGSHEYCAKAIMRNPSWKTGFCQ